MQHILKIGRYLELLSKRNIVTQRAHGLRLSNLRKNLDKLLPQKKEFQARHIGPRQHEQMEMLRLIGFKVTYTCEISSFNEKSIFVFN